MPIINLNILFKIQIITGKLKWQYCEVADLQLHYENFHLPSIISNEAVETCLIYLIVLFYKVLLLFLRIVLINSRKLSIEPELFSDEFHQYIIDRVRIIAYEILKNESTIEHSI